MKYKKILIFFLLFIPLALLSQSNEMIRVKAYGKAPLNIKPASKARVLAFRAAKIVGYKKLAQAAGLEKYTKQETREQHKIQAFLKNARVVSKKYISDFEVEIIMEIPVSEVVEKVSNIKKYRFNNSLIRKLKNKIEGIEMKASKINTELAELKKILDKLEEISE